MYMSADGTMNDIMVTALRKNLLSDVPRKPARRLAALKRRRLIVGDAATLWKVKPAKWRGDANLR